MSLLGLGASMINQTELDFDINYFVMLELIEINREYLFKNCKFY